MNVGVVVAARDEVGEEELAPLTPEDIICVQQSPQNENENNPPKKAECQQERATSTGPSIASSQGLSFLLAHWRCLGHRRRIFQTVRREACRPTYLQYCSARPPTA